MSRLKSLTFIVVCFEKKHNRKDGENKKLEVLKKSKCDNSKLIYNADWTS